MYTEDGSLKKDVKNVQLAMGILKPKEQHIHAFSSIIIEMHRVSNIKNNLKCGHAATRNK